MNEKINATGLKLAYSYLDSNPDKNIPKIMNWVDRFDKNDSMKGQRQAIRKIIE